MKIICADRVSVGHLTMPISNGICQYVWKDTVLNKNICHFLGPSPSALSGKKFESTGTYKNDATLRSRFFSRETRSVTVPRFGFYPEFTDKG